MKQRWAARDCAHEAAVDVVKLIVNPPGRPGSTPGASASPSLLPRGAASPSGRGAAVGNRSLHARGSTGFLVADSHETARRGRREWRPATAVHFRIDDLGVDPRHSSDFTSTSRKSPSPPLRKLASAADTSYRAIESEAPPDEAHRLLCAVQAFGIGLTSFSELSRRFSLFGGGRGGGSDSD